MTGAKNFMIRTATTPSGAKSRLIDCAIVCGGASRSGRLGDAVSGDSIAINVTAVENGSNFRQIRANYGNANPPKVAQGRLERRSRSL